MMALRTQPVTTVNSSPLRTYPIARNHDQLLHAMRDRAQVKPRPSVGEPIAADAAHGIMCPQK